MWKEKAKVVFSLACERAKEDLAEVAVCLGSEVITVCSWVVEEFAAEKALLGRDRHFEAESWMGRHY